jgi:hypothetical protein
MNTLDVAPEKRDNWINVSRHGMPPVISRRDWPLPMETLNGTLSAKYFSLPLDHLWL